MDSHPSTVKVKIGIIQDSGRAFDAFYAATGEPPERIPDGVNTRTNTFIDAKGRPAMLVQQRGFEPTEEEKSQGFDANGLSLAVALDAASPEEGFAALDELVAALDDTAPEHPETRSENGR